MQALYEAEDLGALTETVAVSLTDYIGNISSTLPYGAVWGEKKTNLRFRHDESANAKSVP